MMIRLIPIGYYVFIFVTFSIVNGYSNKLFESHFRAPDPPAEILAEYQASYVQHKWDGTGITHISTGTIYASLAVGRLRIDVSYDGILASSLFDYAKENSDGSIPNYIYSMGPSTGVQGNCTYYNVTPAYPLFPRNILLTGKATYGGLIKDDLFYAEQEPLQAWHLLFAGSTSVTAFVNQNKTVVRMDFSSPFRSTFTTTRLFNIIPGAPDAKHFAHPCPIDSTPWVSSGARRIV